MSIPRRLLPATSPAPAASLPDHPTLLGPGCATLLAALTCALVCFAGLAFIARCACLRRRASEPPTAPKKGVKRKVLDSFPKLAFSRGLAVEGRTVPHDCPICLGEFSEGEELRILPTCGHAFHVACIDRWLAGKSSCPSCRFILVGSTAAISTVIRTSPPPSSSTTITAEATKEAGSCGGSGCLPQFVVRVADGAQVMQD